MEGYEPQKLINEQVKLYGNQIAVACSFGKDSIVVLHMALKANPNIKVVFCNTGVEFPETLAYKEQLKKEWNLNLIETTPYKGMTFWKCKEKYGLPQFRSNKSKVHTPKCCYYCKEKPAFLKYRELGVIAVLTGITASESRNRKLLQLRYDKQTQVGFCGQRYYSKTQALWKIHPIIYWKEQEVWNYIKENDIPINPVYQKWNGIYKRVGCLPCTGYKDWQKKLSITHPQLFKQLSEQKVII
jgi:phosphoadenosine phosphosulfate reductase